MERRAVNVENIMSRDVAACTPETDLAEVVSLMWRHNRDVIPVLSAESRLIGIVTGHDIWATVASQHRPPHELAVRQIMRENPATCHEKDDVRSALITMTQEQLRQLAVVDETDRVTGILSINDVLAAGKGLKKNPLAGDETTIDTLKAVYKPRRGHVPGIESPRLHPS